jgi:aminopeptidase N
MRPFHITASVLAIIAAAAAHPLDAQMRPIPMQPGVSLELARERAATISDVRYALLLNLTRRDSARGNVEVAFERSGTGDLVLDFRGPSLHAVRANGAAVTDYQWAAGHIRIPARYLREGNNRVSAEFTTRIAAAGAPIIRADDPKDATTYLYTLLVPADANALFPCFDQPDLKARVRMRITAPAAWKVVTNGALQERDSLGTAVIWRFGETKPISTYLIAFAAGPWATWESEGLTLYARASRRAEVEADSLIAANRRAAAWLAATSASPSPSTRWTRCWPPPSPSAGWSTWAPSSTTRRSSSSASRPPFRSGWGASRRSTTKSRTSGSATW